MPKKKATPEELKAAAVELQLSQRRFVLESINTAAALLQVPLVTAGIWYYLSRTNPTLGALNKAILAAELAPIIGDIQFPEGVLLGAAMESTEDFLKILEGDGLLEGLGETAEKVISAAEEAAIDSGGVVAEVILTQFPKLHAGTCEELNERLWKAHLLATGRVEGPEGVIKDPYLDPKTGDRIPDSLIFIIQKAQTIEFGLVLQSIKNKGCPRPKSPYNVSETTWAKL